jgi:hypothetical protein
MGLENEIITAFLNELRLSGKLSEPIIAKIELVLGRRSVTQEMILELTKTDVDIQNKKP